MLEKTYTRKKIILLTLLSFHLDIVVLLKGKAIALNENILNRTAGQVMRNLQNDILC